MEIAADLADLAVDLDRLTPLEGNPRRGDVDAVVRSYRRFGQRKPIVARVTGDRDGQPVGEVVAGNHQWAAAHKLGWTRIAVVWVDEDEDTARAFALADNRTADLGTYDERALGEMLQAVKIAGDDDLFAATGFTDDDLAELLGLDDADPSAVGDGDDPDDAEAIVDPITKPGDVWQLGRCRVVCGDATDATVVAQALDGKLADCVWTDPPYGVAVVGGSRMESVEERLAKGGKTIRNDALGGDALRGLLEGAFKATTANTIDGAAVYVAHPAGALAVTFGQAFLAAGWRLHETLVWVKNSMVLGHSDYHYMHEPILFGYTPGGGRRGRGGDGWYGDHKQTTVLEYDRPPRSEDHPTMKPVALVAHCLRNSTPPRGVVLDPFAGSGTTMIAAHDLSRTAALVELDPRYVDVICRRYQRHTGDNPVLAAATGDRDASFIGEPFDFEAPVDARGDG